MFVVLVVLVVFVVFVVLVVFEVLLLFVLLLLLLVLLELLLEAVWLFSFSAASFSAFFFSASSFRLFISSVSDGSMTPGSAGVVVPSEAFTFGPVVGLAVVLPVLDAICPVPSSFERSPKSITPPTIMTAARSAAPTITKVLLLESSLKKFTTPPVILSRKLVLSPFPLL